MQPSLAGKLPQRRPDRYNPQRYPASLPSLPSRCWGCPGRPVMYDDRREAHGSPPAPMLQARNCRQLAWARCWEAIVSRLGDSLRRRCWPSLSLSGRAFGRGTFVHRPGCLGVSGPRPGTTDRDGAPAPGELRDFFRPFPAWGLRTGHCRLTASGIGGRFVVSSRPLSVHFVQSSSGRRERARRLILSAIYTQHGIIRAGGSAKKKDRASSATWTMHCVS